MKVFLLAWVLPYFVSAVLTVNNGGGSPFDTLKEIVDKLHSKFSGTNGLDNDSVLNAHVLAALKELTTLQVSLDSGHTTSASSSTPTSLQQQLTSSGRRNICDYILIKNEPYVCNHFFDISPPAYNETDYFSDFDHCYQEARTGGCIKWVNNYFRNLVRMWNPSDSPDGNFRKKQDCAYNVTSSKVLKTSKGNNIEFKFVVSQYD